jgi:hypothetical protein
MPAVEIHPPEDQLIRAQKAGMLIEPSPSIPPSGMPLSRGTNPTTATVQPPGRERHDVADGVLHGAVAGVSDLH